jgi:anti-anti-sigma regulatory factor
MATTARSRPALLAECPAPDTPPADEPVIEFRYDGSEYARIRLGGRVDAQLVGTLGQLLRVLLRTHARFIVLDLARAVAWDSALLELVLRTQRRLGGRAGMISMVGVDPTARVPAAPDGPAGPAPRPAVLAPARHVAPVLLAT